MRAGFASGSARSRRPVLGLCVIASRCVTLSPRRPWLPHDQAPPGPGRTRRPARPPSGPACTLVSDAANKKRPAPRGAGLDGGRSGFGRQLQRWEQCHRPGPTLVSQRQHWSGITGQSAIPDVVGRGSTGQTAIPDVVAGDITGQSAIPDVVGRGSTCQTANPDVVAGDITGQSAIAGGVGLRQQWSGFTGQSAIPDVDGRGEHGRGCALGLASLCGSHTGQHRCEKPAGAQGPTQSLLHEAFS